MSKKRLLALVLSLGGLILLTSCQIRIQLGKTQDSTERSSETRKDMEVPEESTTETTELREEVASTTEVPETTAQSKTENTEDSTEAEEKPAEETQRGITVADIMDMDAGRVLSQEDLEAIDIDELFTSEAISDKVFDRMDGVSFGKDCTTKRKDLRYLRVLHRGFDGETHIGEIVCNRAIAKDFLYIFRQLYEEDYPIEKILLVDEYGGDDEMSMEDNNSSCFNFRPVAGTGHLSQHAYGRAIDINPLYNPYITSDGFVPLNAGDYVDRSAENPYKIDRNDLCYQLFDERGFTWGGSWNSVKDYQHFQKKE